MIALIEDTCVEKKQWISHDEMMNVTVIAESTPVPIMVNLASYVGSITMKKNTGVQPALYPKPA